MIGGVLGPQNTLQPPSAQSLYIPEDVFLVNDVPYVQDSGNNRILRFAKPDPSTPPAAPAAEIVIGQATMADYKPNGGAPQPADGTTLPAVSFSEPAYAARAAGELFVVDAGNNRVLVLPDPNPSAATGISISAKRVLGQDYLYTNAPNLVEGREFHFGSEGGGVVVDTHSNPPRLYVADTFNNRVLGFKDARVVRPGDKADLVIGQPDFIRVLANYPSGRSDLPTRKSLYQPTGLAVDAAGNLYVADSTNGRVLRFPSPFDHGNYPDADIVLGKPGFNTPSDPASDASPTNMGAPYGLAFSSDGNLLVSDLGFNRVVQLRKPQGGDFVTGMTASRVIGQADFFSRTAGTTNNRLNAPHHISMDTNDTLFVCDTSNNRVQAYDSTVWKVADGVNATLTLTRADPFGSLSAPQGIFVSAVTGEIWVASSGGQYILRYPKFATLVVSPLPNFAISSNANIEHPLALTVDAFSNLLVVFSTNRLALYFPASTSVNAANYLTRLAPDMYAALYPMGFVLGSQTASSSSLPLPTVLADLQVLVNNQPAPLLFVSPSQINYILPMATPSSGNVEVQVVRQSTGQILAVGCSALKVATNPDSYVCNGTLQMDVASPALFAGGGYASATGQIAANNRKTSDGTYYGVNSATNPVSRSDIVELYGTGQGFIPNAPPDGAAPGSNPLYSTPGDKPQVIVNIARVPDENVTFSGLNPAFPGLWQVNVKIPDTTPPGNAIQVVIVYKGIPSNDPANPGRIVTTIAVKQ